MMVDPSRKAYTVSQQSFIIDKHLELTRELGRGAYGIVCAAQCPNSPGVAVKKITNIFSKKILCKRALREMKLLIHFRGHKNITCLYDLDVVNPASFNEIYLYEELMECDLHQIIRSKQPLTDSHFQSFVYQILAGLKYIHSAGVLHRDLKPGNLLVNADCEVKICDFGLARGFDENANEVNAMTEYVATRWYRAPEIMLSIYNYTKAIDVWSVGCILAELFGGKPFFKGESPFDQLNQILKVLGTPSPETVKRIGSERAQEYLSSLPYSQPIPLSYFFPYANPEGLDLLGRMLTFDPYYRITVEEALEHPYLRVWHDPADEPACQELFNFDFESIEDLGELKEVIATDVENFRQVVRQQSSSLGTGTWTDTETNQIYANEPQHQHYSVEGGEAGTDFEATPVPH